MKFPHHEIKRMQLSRIKPQKDYPRTMTDEARKGLEYSMSRFGVASPIVWNRRTGHIVNGYQRFQILVSHKVKTSDVVVVDLSRTEEEAFRMALHNKAIEAKWNAEIEKAQAKVLAELPKEFEELKLDQVTYAVPVQTVECSEEDDAVPEPPKKARTKSGQLFQLGNHRLLCGDSTKKEDVERLMDGNSAVACITDPPYSVNYENIKRKKSVKTRKQNGDAYRDPPAKEVLTFIECVPSDILIMTYPLAKHFQLLAEKTTGWDLLYDCIWSKSNFAFILSRRYQMKHEIIWIFRRKKGRGIFNIPSSQSTVFEFPKPAASKEHPTIKPLALYEKLVRYHSNPGNSVYEPFSGSGTTVLACERTSRVCFAMEREPIYCDVTIKRWEDLTGKKAKRL